MELPTTQLEFEEQFGTEEQCVAFLRQRRWPEGFRCPKCAGAKSWSLECRAIDECATCGHQVSLTAGTVFHGTRKPLTMWFRVMSCMVVSKQGVSAKEIQRLFGLNYETAWAWLHKLRSMLAKGVRKALTGTIEVDETFYGGEDIAPHRGRSISGKKVPVICAAEIRGDRTGRIRLSQISDTTADSLVGFMKETISPESIVKTDGHQGYVATAKSFKHERVVIGDGKRAPALFPHVHRVFSLFKRWLACTHQGAVGARHLPHYLAEFVFRFNRRNSGTRWLLWDRLVSTCFSRPPTLSLLLKQPEPQSVGVT